MKLLRKLSSGQSELIAGLIILSIIFAVTLPLMIDVQSSLLRERSYVVSKAKFLEIKQLEALTVAGVPETDENLRRGLVPAIWINNTGTVPVTLYTMFLVNKENGTVDYIIDMAYVNKHPIIKWAVKNPHTDPQILESGEYPTLNPEETLLIKFELSTEEAGKYEIKVVTARGNILPGGSTGSPIVPSKTELGGGVYRGLFYPISGFKLLGGHQILANSDVVAERPEGLEDDEYVGGVDRAWIYDDYEHPGYYIVGYEDGWTRVEYRGFLGTYTINTDDAGRLYVYIDGYYMEKYVNGVLEESHSVARYRYPGEYGFIDDMDGNNVTELLLNTIPEDADENYISLDDVLMMKVTIARDITNADYVRISTKITYDYYVRIGSGIPRRMDLRIFYVAVYRYTDRGWRFVHYKDMPFSEHGPRSFVFDAVFPLNRSDIYRVTLMLIDPYRSTDRDYYEFSIGLEYVLVEWGINNPYFEDLPTVYLLALEGYATEGIGGDDKIANLTTLIANELLSVGITNYIVIDSEELLNILLLNNPPKGAIVINLHGMQSPIDPATVRDLIEENGWIWVNIVGDAPVRPDNISFEIGIERNGTILPGSDGDYMIGNFSLYDLPTTIESNYSVVATNNYPTYLFYVAENTSDIVISAAWKVGEGYIVINALPEIDWMGEGTEGSDPELVARLATFTALYIWLVPK